MKYNYIPTETVPRSLYLRLCFSIDVKTKQKKIYLFHRLQIVYANCEHLFIQFGREVNCRIVEICI